MKEVPLTQPEALSPHELGTEIARELGIEDIVDEVVVAHGRQFTIGSALVECDPFADMVRAVAAGTASLPEEARQAVLKNSVTDMAQRSRQKALSDEQTNRADNVQAQDAERVKKN